MDRIRNANGPDRRVCNTTSIRAMARCVSIWLIHVTFGAKRSDGPERRARTDCSLVTGHCAGRVWTVDGVREAEGETRHQRRSAAMPLPTDTTGNTYGLMRQVKINTIFSCAVHFVLL